jgi:phytoene dehydrogenase-like protein
MIRSPTLGPDEAGIKGGRSAMNWPTHAHGRWRWVMVDSTTGVWDYIVVGAGHNGLSAACTVAEGGSSVLVVDQLPFLGGLSSSRAWVPEAPRHLLSVGAMDDMLMAQTPLTEELGLRAHGYEPIPLEAPYGWINEDGATLLLFRDFDRTVADIRRFSPKDARTYAEIRPALDLIMDLVDQLVPRHPAALGKRDMGKLLLRLAPDRRTRRLLARCLR